MVTTVVALVGSSVDDFHAELSRVYTRGFLDAFADEPGYCLRIAFVSPGGRWSFPGGIEPSDVAAADQLTLAEAIAWIEDAHVDVVVPQMFCKPGMTTYRSLFELLSIPLLGNRPDVMALTADKSLARAVVSASGVAVPEGQLVRAAGAVESVDVPLPVVVKPVDSDNSMGVTVVREQSNLGDAVYDALEYSSAALVESYIPLGREVRCGIIARDGELVCLPLEEYAVEEGVNPIRGRADKLDRSEVGALYLVAKDPQKAWIVDVDDPITETVWAAARASYVALGCRHYGLFDFRVDPQGRPWFLEAGLYCSYSPSSVVAVMAAAAGISVTELFALSLRELSEERIQR